MARRFPTFGFMILVLAVIWLLKDLGYITINLPIIPILLILISLGWIINSLIRG